MTASPTNSVAVIGMAGRFPGAANLTVFWSNLATATESIVRLSREELLAWGEDPATVDDPAHVPMHGAMDEIEWFDADFFGYTPRDATLIDPQQRVFLECAWEALEDAGYDPRRYRGDVGVFAGLKNPQYRWLAEAQRWRFPAIDDYQVSLGSDPDGLSMRVAYKLGLTGPALTVMTACSTGLVAVHQACQALLGGECDMALAGGVALAVPRQGHLYHEGGVLSPDGRCRAFDAGANGTVGGDGAGVVVLKLLADALADGDDVRAVILGSAVNQDGGSRLGFTAPSVEGQTRVIRRAQVVAQVQADTITYVETHGTGTAVGDPIEIAGLTRAFRATTDRAGFCAIGSVKTNIGHTDAAAGVAGLIKVVLSLQHRLLPPSLHFHEPNPRIDFASTPFRVNTELRAWETGELPRRAGVSAFGMGGTNAHAVLEEAPPPGPSRADLPRQLLVLSARNPTALESMGANLADHLARHLDLALADVAHTLQTGRREMAWRRFLVCSEREEAIAALRGTPPGGTVTGDGEPRARPVIFMFPGQGSQHVGMARELYEWVPFFREQVDVCCDLLAPLLGLDVRELLYGGDESRGDAAARLTRTEIAQPAIFTVEYALARLWMHLGVTPAGMIGHSLGELVAATLAGVFSLEDATALVADRGRIVQGLPAGSMVAVPLPAAEVEPLIGLELSIAAVNGPRRSVVSGALGPVEALARRLEERGVETRQLYTSHAFHSPMVDPVVPVFEERVRSAQRRMPELPFVSNRSGDWIRPEEAVDPGYWAGHLRETVRFGDGLAALFREEDGVLLEVGPGQVLTDLARQHPARPDGRQVIPTLPRATERTPALSAMLSAAGRLWLGGQPIAWAGLHLGGRRRVPLPTYPFQRQPYLLDMTARASAERAAAERAPPAPPAEEPAVRSSEAPAPGPNADIERSVAMLFSEVLGIAAVGAGDSFFDLGGDSLIATQLISRARETFTPDLPLEAVFEQPTVAGLAGEIANLLAGEEGMPGPATERVIRGL